MNEVTKIIIIGGEGNGGVAAACIVDMQKSYHRADIEVMGFLNDMIGKGEKINGFPVLGKTTDWPQFCSDESVRFIFAIHPIGHGPLRVKLFESLNIPDRLLFTLIHPKAFVAYNAELGPGVMVMSNSYIGASTKLGRCVFCMANTAIGHDTKFGPYCHVSLGAVVGSYVNVGTASDIALNAIVMEKIIIEDFAVVGAGAMITKNVHRSEVVIGNPQRVLRMTEDKQHYTL
ncbi:MAG: sugar O-acyltransferase [Candidatus Cloacimonetes bacterium]|jgi:sugar O-acyltransferase (sialic acid O-acetyltransferase NeuD family)|nr:sugar O-acyltransferase [Candidatus Cloacimonadota bacterium]